MDSRRVMRLLGTITSARGRTSEERVLEACEIGDRPAWLYSARLATKAEDHAGIDVVFESDVGKL